MPRLSKASLIYWALCAAGVAMVALTAADRDTTALQYCGAVVFFLAGYFVRDFGSR